MVCGDELWGLIEVYDNRAGGFVARDIGLAETIVARTCAVLERLAAN
jgi:hypothetical protein